MRSLVFLLLFLCANTNAEVLVQVRDKTTEQVTSAAIDVASGKVRLSESRIDSPLPSIDSFSIKAGNLYHNGRVVGTGDELLYQCNAEGFDLVVVREEYNSFFANPEEALAALAGHPIQGSKIRLLAVSEMGAVWEHELTRAEASYSWSAQVGN